MTTDYSNYSVQMLGFRSTWAVRRAMKEQGSHWFDRNTMRFFGSRVHKDVYAGRYFITSELGFSGTKRKYSIREIVILGSELNIVTVGEFRGYDTAQDARKAISLLVNGGVENA